MSDECSAGVATFGAGAFNARQRDDAPGADEVRHGDGDEKSGEGDSRKGGRNLVGDETGCPMPDAPFGEDDAGCEVGQEGEEHDEDGNAAARVENRKTDACSGQ